MKRNHAGLFLVSSFAMEKEGEQSSCTTLNKGLSITQLQEYAQQISFQLSRAKEVSQLKNLRVTICSSLYRALHLEFPLTRPMGMSLPYVQHYI